MTTFTHQYLVKLIPDSEIERIMDKANPDTTETTNLDDIAIPTHPADASDIQGEVTYKPLTITKVDLSGINDVGDDDDTGNDDKNGNEDEIMTLYEEIGNVTKKVEASKRYVYKYTNHERYLIEKGADSFYIDKIDVKSKIFEGRLLIISDPSKVKLGLTSNLGKSGQKLQTILDNYGAIAGINAGGYDDPGWVGNGGVPIGLVISDGVKISDYDGNNVVGFTEDHKLVVGYYSKENFEKLNLRDAITFNPALIVNGKPQFKEADNSATGIHPRSAIGQRKTGEVLMLTIDGRQWHSIGATLKDVQDILLENGAYNAANLDGGHSSVMKFNGEYMNKPCSSSGERPIASAFIVVP